MGFRKRGLGVGLIVAVAAMLVMAVGTGAAFGYSEFKTTNWPDHFKGEGGAATFQAENGGTITCEKSSTAGVWESFTLLKVVVSFSGKCEIKSPIVNGACAEPLATNELDLEPGEIGGGSNRGVLFKPARARATEMANGDCGGVAIKITGALVCEDNPNTGKPSTMLKIACADAAPAQQLYTSIDVKGTVLSKQELSGQSIEGVFNGQAALATNETLTFEYPVEQT
jgi:hypothetical protein